MKWPLMRAFQSRSGKKQRMLRRIYW
ncbi:hypothetical protein ID866_3655 [Astraeus odoratus]|nr:hypothetical protein ID866_3655 [Astraeus odoratus]